MYVVVSYAMATFFMYTIKFPTYTGWSRLQSICCIPFLYTTDASIATDLIILNSFGCLFSVHVFYSLSQYHILHTLASRSLQPYAFYQQSNHKKQLHYIADFILHGTPACLCVFLNPTPYAYQSYVWILPAMTHVTYPYFLTGSFNPAPLYKMTGYDDAYKHGWFWTCVAYYGISLCLRYTVLEKLLMNIKSTETI